MKQQHYIIIILLLVVLNVFSWRMWWDRPNIEKRFKERVEHFKEKPEREEQGLRYLIHKLGLNDAQMQEFKTLRYKHFQQMHKKEAQLEQMRKTLFESLKSDGVDVDQQQLFDDMARIRVGMEEEMYKHLSGMRKVCTTEQEAQFDLLFIKMMDQDPQRQNGPKGDREGRKGERRHKGNNNKYQGTQK